MHSRAQVPPGAEAVFFGGNGFRAIGAIAALEEDLGIRQPGSKPVCGSQSMDTAEYSER
jgi:hypothetical protein